LPLFLSKGNYKLVYSSSEPILLTTLYNGFWAKLFKAKHIFFTWENIPYEKKFSGWNLIFKKIILRFNLALADGVICGNKKGEEMFKKITDKPVEVIPLSGVDVDFFRRRQDVPKKIEDSNLDGKIVFNFSGAIGYRKGIHIILKAFKKVLAELPNAHLLVVGSGEYESKMRKLMDELGIKKNITLIGWLDREGLKKAFNISDVFLYPSLSYEGWEEQFGYSMAEASLMELPVIATQTGSIEEVVVGEETGILVEAGNEQQLIDAMLRLGRDAELRERMGRAGRKYIETHFSYQKVAGEFYKFFNLFK